MNQNLRQRTRERTNGFDEDFYNRLELLVDKIENQSKKLTFRRDKVTMAEVRFFEYLNQLGQSPKKPDQRLYSSYVERYINCQIRREKYILCKREIPRGVNLSKFKNSVPVYA